MSCLVKTLPFFVFISFSLNVVHVRGKRGRQVSIVFNEIEKKGLEALVKYRHVVGVSEENVYVFAAPTRSSRKPLRGNDCMRKVIGDIPDLKFPERIRSNELRKYCATVMQIVDLEETQLRWLADHLGHNMDVHREYYRLRESTVELSKVSRLLLAMDEGKSQNFAGKKLSKIKLEGIILEFLVSYFLYWNSG